MTPFGKKVRSLRAERGLTQKQMAESIGVSPAYLSALEMGKKGRPSFALVQQIITYFNIIWDDAEELIELAGISHPRIVIDTSNLSADATSFANRLSRQIKKLTDSDIALLTTLLDRAKQKNKTHGI